MSTSYKRLTFSDRIELVLEREQASVFPHREQVSREGLHLIFWHSFPSEAQVAERIQRGISEAEALMLSACDGIMFSEAEMPLRLLRTKEPVLCRICVKKSELSQTEFLEKARHIRDEAHALQDALQNH